MAPDGPLRGPQVNATALGAPRSPSTKGVAYLSEGLALDEVPARLVVVGGGY